MTAKQTPKAQTKLDELYSDLDASDEEFTKPQLVLKEIKAVAPVYAPVAIIAGTSTACIIGAYSSGKKKAAALAAAYEVSEEFTKTYISKVKEKLGEKTESEIRDETYEEISKNHLPEKGDCANIVNTEHGDQLFFDSGSNTYFRSSVRWLEKVRSEVTDEIRNGATNEVGVNDMRWKIGLPPCALGNLGSLDLNDIDTWNHAIDMRWDRRCYMAPWGETYGVLEYPIHERFRG